MFRRRSISAWLNPTTGRLPIRVTGTPLCPVIRTMSMAAAASRETSTSRKVKPLLWRYCLTRRHQGQVGVVNRTMRGWLCGMEKSLLNQDV